MKRGAGQALKAAGIYADLSRTCEGCKDIKTEPWTKDRMAYRCFAPGPCQGRNVGIDRFLPYVPAWCPKMRRKETDDGTGK